MLISARTYYCEKGTTPEEFPFSLDHLTPEILKEYGVEKLSPITKLFFDYDQNFKPEQAKEMEETRKELRSRLQEHSLSYANGFVYTEAVQPNKVSFHVVFNRIAIERKTFHPALEYELFASIVGEERFQHIDPRVYGEKLWFRLPYGTLYDKPYAHLPQNSNRLSDYVVSLPDDVRTKSYDLHPYRINQKFEKLMDEYRYADSHDEEDNLTERQERITTLLGLLKPQRFKSHDAWFKLMCLCRGNGVPRSEFIKLSQASGYEKFNENECIKQFEALVPKRTFGFPLLHAWLDEDGVDWRALYPRLSPIVRAVKNLESQDFGCTDFGLTTILRQFYKDDLFYVQNFGWIHYNGAMWEHGSDTMIFYPIMRLLSADLCLFIKAKLDRITKKIISLKNTPKAEMTDSIKMEIQVENMKFEEAKLQFKNYRHIQSAGCIKSVLQVAQNLFTDNAILETFNAKPHLFTFKNGVSINLLTGERVEVTKEQRLLVSCGYDLPERNQADVDLVNKILQSIIPPERYNSFIKNMAILLCGNNTNECILVWKGIGRNGKGVIARILELALGLYFQALPITELTEESKGKGGTSSELANARFARCLMATEPEGHHTFKTGTIKKLTGGDPIPVRQLYQQATEYIPQFTLCLQLNDDPVFSKLDDALIKRIHIEVFPYQFVAEPDANLTYQKPLDDTLKLKITNDEAYRNGLLWILIDAFISSQGKLERTIASKEASRNWIEETNPLNVFLSTYEPSVEFIRIKDLRDDFNNSYPRDKLTKGSFKHNLLLCHIKTEEDESNGMKVFLRKKM